MFRDFESYDLSEVTRGRSSKPFRITRINYLFASIRHICQPMSFGWWFDRGNMSRIVNPPMVDPGGFCDARPTVVQKVLEELTKFNSLNKADGTWWVKFRCGGSGVQVFQSAGGCFCWCRRFFSVLLTVCHLGRPSSISSFAVLKRDCMRPMSSNSACWTLVKRTPGSIRSFEKAVLTLTSAYNGPFPERSQTDFLTQYGLLQKHYMDYMHLFSCYDTGYLVSSPFKWGTRSCVHAPPLI